MYGDSIRAGGASVGAVPRVGQNGNQPPVAVPPPVALPPGAPPGYYPPNAYCGINAPVCPTECPQRRIIGGHSTLIPAGGGGTILIQSQVPFVARGWGIDSASAPLVRFSGILNGVCNLILGGDVNGEAGLPCCCMSCGSVVDGYPLLPGQNMQFTFTNFSGGAVEVDVWVCGELLCP